MKKYVVLLILCIVGIALARRNYNPSSDAEGLSDGSALMSSQIAWNIADETASGATVSDLLVTERTYALVVAAIATGANNDDEISIIHIPPTWNGVRFRCIGKAEDGIVTYQIYFGTLAGGTNCELVKAGQLAFVIGTQVSTTTDYEMAEKITTTASSWVLSWGDISPRNNTVAEGAINAMGADLIVVLATAVNTDCKLLVKGY